MCNEATLGVGFLFKFVIAEWRTIQYLLNGCVEKKGCIESKYRFNKVQRNEPKLNISKNNLDNVLSTNIGRKS